MEEIWKDVKGYEGYYKYNPFSGKIMSIGGRRGGHREDYILGEYFDSSGYPQVIFRVNGKNKTKKVHRIIAENELPNPKGYTDIDHINGIKTDNRVDNLRWCSHKDNCNNPITKDKMLKTVRSEEYRKKCSEREKGKKLSDETKKKMSISRTGSSNWRSKTVYQYSLDGNLIAIYESTGIAAKETNSIQSQISNCCNGKIKKHNGFIWRYKEESVA